MEVIDILQTIALCIGAVSLTVIAIMLFLLGTTLLAPLRIEDLDDEYEDEIDIPRQRAKSKQWRKKHQR
ncbi:MAG: hypothetical protein JXB30_00755 [Anaerolineae bacterium]|nr:hypothetical protein [Anaerolineae bacterium]